MKTESLDLPISREEVLKDITKLKIKNKSPVLTYSHLSCSLTQLIYCTTQYVNYLTIFVTATMGALVPLPKHGDLSDANNYRVYICIYKYIFVIIFSYIRQSLTIWGRRKQDS